MTKANAKKAAALSLAKVKQVWTNNPDYWVSNRDDHHSLMQGIGAIKGPLWVKLLFGCFLHSLYFRAAKKLAQPHLIGTHFKDSASAAELRPVLKNGLKAITQYKGAKSFPFQVPGGVRCWKSLLKGSTLEKLILACKKAAKHPQPTMSNIDRLLPMQMGAYSLRPITAKAYLRRHLSRSIALYLGGVGTEACWTLSMKGMGRGPPEAANAVGIEDYAAAVECMAYIGCKCLHSLVQLRA
jgi:hypothetical protein